MKTQGRRDRGMVARNSDRVPVTNSNNDVVDGELSDVEEMGDSSPSTMRLRLISNRVGRHTCCFHRRAWTTAQAVMLRAPRALTASMTAAAD